MSHADLFSPERCRNMRNQAAGLVRKMEQENARLGIDQANEMLHVLAPDSAHWTRVNEKAMESMAGTLADGSPLEQLIREAAGASAQAMEEALLSGIAIGQGVNTIAWNMHKAANIPYERAVRIARTEINRSYRIASHRQYQASNGVVAGYRRMCFKPTACFACLMLDGEFYPIEAGPMDDHPNGKCTPIPVLRSQVNKPPEWETGREWFKAQDEETQRKLMGAGRFDLWKQGMDPRDMVYIKDNPVWGGSPSVKTLESLRFVLDNNLHQEGVDPSIPERYQGDFSDYDPLDIDSETRNIFSELRSLTQQNHYEYGLAIGKKNRSKILSNESFDGVKISLDTIEGSDIKIYHSHTNVTPLSSADLRRLCEPRVNEVGNIAINGDIYIARIGDGVKPEPSEFDEANKRIKKEVDLDLQKDPYFMECTYEEKSYMFIREKFYRIVREFGWQIEGGNIDG